MQANVTQMKKRPVWVWIISVFFIFSAAYTLISFYLIFSGKVNLAAEQKAFIESLTIVDLVLTVIIGLTNLSGTVLLFLLRKKAFYFFLASLAANLSTGVWSIINKGIISVMTPSVLIGMLLAWGLMLGVCFYTKKLEKKGVLR